MARRIVTSEEQDAFTSWRKYYCYLQRAGAVKRIKQRANRRERRAARQAIRKGDE